MKTLKIKFLVPIIAIGLALTTSAFTNVDNSEDDSLFAITGYTMNLPGQPCNQVSVDCKVSGQIPCTFNGQQVFKDLNVTSCATELFRN